MEAWGVGIIIVVQVLLLAALVYGVFRAAEWWHRRRHEKSPMSILEERFARGEIDTAEFAERRELLLSREGDPPAKQTQ